MSAPAPSSRSGNNALSTHLRGGTDAGGKRVSGLVRKGRGWRVSKRGHNRGQPIPQQSSIARTHQCRALRRSLQRRARWTGRRHHLTPQSQPNTVTRNRNETDERENGAGSDHHDSFSIRNQIKKTSKSSTHTSRQLKEAAMWASAAPWTESGATTRRK